MPVAIPNGDAVGAPRATSRRGRSRSPVNNTPRDEVVPSTAAAAAAAAAAKAYRSNWPSNSATTTTSSCTTASASTITGHNNSNAPVPSSTDRGGGNNPKSSRNNNNPSVTASSSKAPSSSASTPDRGGTSGGGGGGGGDQHIFRPATASTGPPPGPWPPGSPYPPNHPSPPYHHLHHLSRRYPPPSHYHHHPQHHPPPPPHHPAYHGGDPYLDTRSPVPTIHSRGPRDVAYPPTDRYGRPLFDYSAPTTTPSVSHHPPYYPPHGPPPPRGMYGEPSPHRRSRYPSARGAGDPYGGGPTPMPKSPKTRNRDEIFRKPPEATASTAAESGRPRGKKDTKNDDDDDDDDHDEDTPQRILLSLRTPSHSFEVVATRKDDRTEEEEEDPDKDENDARNNRHKDEDPSKTVVKTDRRSSPTDPLLVAQRSVDCSRVGSIEMAPSFTLFNQSFDSFANDGHLSLNADSFGFGRTESSAAMDGILRQNPSLPPVGGSFAYSPVHSFDAVHHHPHHPVTAAAVTAPLPPPTTQILYRRPFSPMMPPTFYSFLGKFKEAFQGCTFLLPGLKTIVIETKTGTTESKDEETPDAATSQSPPLGITPSPDDLVIARRRIQSSICAFGGSLHPINDVNNENKRHKLYAEALATRYYENESRLSWEFEENPPVIIDKESEAKNDSYKDKSKTPDSITSGKRDSDESVYMDGMSVKSGSDEDYCRSVSSEGDHSDKKSHGSHSKMKYRCKLCGQPKQNHRCPYQQSLARSIGVMIYPAVNAFAAEEPGLIAPPLSEMNNFIDIQKTDVMTDISPARPIPTASRRSSASATTTAQVTPESLRSGRSSRRAKKRLYSQTKGDQGDLLFVESMDVKPIQFKTVSAAVATNDGYQYVPLPLPYAQRKRLSDNLFTLSNDVPKLTNECAQVLREAREKDMWDLAVAELMTQVIVIIHCNDRDFRFEGLRQYLLTLGIAC